MNSDELTNAITYILGFAYRGLQFYTQYLIYSVSYHSLSGHDMPRPRVICLQDGFCVGSSSTPLALLFIHMTFNVAMTMWSRD